VSNHEALISQQPYAIVLHLKKSNRVRARPFASRKHADLSCSRYLSRATRNPFEGYLTS
jgi:hypothetical protein